MTAEVILENDQVCCDRHREPFAAKWPMGWDKFKAAALSLLMRDPDFAEACGNDELNVPKLLDVTPVCCRLHRDQMLQLYTRSGIGKQAVCINCHNRAWGTPYRSFTGPRTAVTIEHLCFVCVTRRMVKTK